MAPKPGFEVLILIWSVNACERRLGMTMNKLDPTRHPKPCLNFAALSSPAFPHLGFQPLRRRAMHLDTAEVGSPRFRKLYFSHRCTPCPIEKRVS